MDGFRFRTRRRAAAVGALSVAALLMMLFFSLALWGCGEEETAPLPAEIEEPSFERIEGLSADQSRSVAEFGYPDHFFISIDPASSDRVERWTYFSRGKAIDFNKGRAFGEESIEDESAQYPPTDLRPQDFDALLTQAEASQFLGEPLYIQEVEDSLMPENTIIVYEKVILLYRGDQLIGVETQVRPPQLSPP